MINNDKRLAVIVGIDDYGWEGGKLNGCVNDANKMTKMLESEYDGRPNFYCKTLTSSKEEITTHLLRKNLEELFKKEANIALFYFSGHGHKDSLGGKLVTQDARRFDEGIDVNEVIRLANQAKKIQEIFIILDCCHSGYMANNNIELRQGISILTASLSHEYSMEVNGQGLFTKIILDGLSGEAADTLGMVTAASLYNYADKILGFWEQRPVFKAHCTQMTTIRQTKPKLSLKMLYKIIEYFPSEEYQFSLDKSYEPTEEPRNEINEAIFSELQEFTRASLVVPNNEEHMYFAAMNNKSCSLTSLGKFYWKMVSRRKV